MAEVGGCAYDVVIVVVVSVISCMSSAIGTSCSVDRNCSTCRLHTAVR